MQALAPVSFWNLPASQLAHAAPRAVPLKVPGEHVTHAVLLVELSSGLAVP